MNGTDADNATSERRRGARSPLERSRVPEFCCVAAFFRHESGAMVLKVYWALAPSDGQFFYFWVVASARDESARFYPDARSLGPLSLLLQTETVLEPGKKC